MFYNYLFSFNRKSEFQPEGLCFMGGGILAFCHLGALQALEDLQKLNSIKNFSGSSAGSIVATMCACGCKPSQYKEIFNWDISKLLSYSWLDNDNISSLITKCGLEDGEKLRDFLSELLIKACGNKDITFLDIYESMGNNLTITATQVTKTRFIPIYYNHKTHPMKKVIDALYDSCCYPFVFSPVNCIIDGGLSDNFPIEKLECENKLGFAFEFPDNDDISIPNGIIQFSTAMFRGIYNKIGVKDHYDNTILFPISNAFSLDFSVESDKKEELYQTGYAKTKEYFK